MFLINMEDRQIEARIEGRPVSGFYTQKHDMHWLKDQYLDDAFKTVLCRFQGRFCGIVVKW